MRPAFTSSTNKRPTAALPRDEDLVSNLAALGVDRDAYAPPGLVAPKAQ
jgi:hypothetical protein